MIYQTLIKHYNKIIYFNSKVNKIKNIIYKNNTRNDIVLRFEYEDELKITFNSRYKLLRILNLVNCYCDFKIFETLDLQSKTLMEKTIHDKQNSFTLNKKIIIKFYEMCQIIK